MSKAIMILFILVGVLLVSISIYKFINKIKEEDSRKSKWKLVAIYLLDIILEPLLGISICFIAGMFLIIFGVLFFPW